VGKRASKKLRQSGILPFELEEVEGLWPITSFAGLPLVAEAFRACGADRALAQGPTTRVRHRERGLSDAEMAESFCLLLAAGGDHIDDLEALRDDEGLAELVGYELPSPTRQGATKPGRPTMRPPYTCLLSWCCPLWRCLAV